MKNATFMKTTKLNNCAFTLVVNDFVLLELWLSYYKKYFETLVVLGLGTKKEYDAYIQLRSQQVPFTFILLARPPSEEYNRLCQIDQIIGDIKEWQQKLLKTHDWVLHSDYDEYVVADPRKYKDLRDFMNRCKVEKTYCEAYDVYQEENEEPIDYTKPYLLQRKYWFKDISYNKPLLARVPLNWMQGCHKEAEMSDEESRVIKDTGLFLLHLKYSDIETKRDLLPDTRGSINMSIVKEGKLRRELIPKKIRKLF